MKTTEIAASSEDILIEKVVPPPREVWKPDISKLQNAVVGGEFLAKVGQDVIIQYPEPWRETALWRVSEVLDENCPTETIECYVTEKSETIKRNFTCVKGTTCRPGHVRLYDVQKMHYGATNYLDAEKRGLIIKLWTGKLPE